jgi:anti-anti-sigma factor
VPGRGEDRAEARVDTRLGRGVSKRHDMGISELVGPPPSDPGRAGGNRDGRDGPTCGRWRGRLRPKRGVDLSPSAAQSGPPLADCLRPPGPIHLEVSEDQDGEDTVLRAEGEIDVVTAPTLSACLDAVVRRRRGDVVLDLTETGFLDSAGLHVLLNARRRLTRCSRRLSVVCGSGPVRDVIEVARVAETLNLADPENREPRTARTTRTTRRRAPSPTRRPSARPLARSARRSRS